MQTEQSLLAISIFFFFHHVFNSLPNNNILDCTKLKALADYKFNVVKVIFFFFFDRLENFVRKGDNAGYQHFLLFPPYFQKTVSSGSLQVGIVWDRFK